MPTDKKRVPHFERKLQQKCESFQFFLAVDKHKRTFSGFFPRFLNLHDKKSATAQFYRSSKFNKSIIIHLYAQYAYKTCKTLFTTYLSFDNSFDEFLE